VRVRNIWNRKNRNRP